MKIEAYHTITFFTALGYALSTLFLKRSLQEGVGTWRMVFLSNVCMALVAIPAVFLDGWTFSWVVAWGAFVCAVCFFIGQVGTFVAMTMGDISLATPIMGAKIILVALFLKFFYGESQSDSLWGSALLATVSVVLLQLGGGKESRRAFLTVITALLTAASFAATDVFIQKFSGNIGVQSLLPAMFWWLGIFSFFLIPFFQGSLGNISLNAWKWLLPGCLLLTFQAIAITAVIGYYGHATEVNIVYNTRGLWSILLVWVLGHWFGNTERHVGHGFMAVRLAGAFLMLLSLVWMFF